MMSENKKTLVIGASENPSRYAFIAANRLLQYGHDIVLLGNRKGMIRQGYLADIVIVDKDLLTIPETEIMKTKVDYTIVGGKVVYRSGH